MRIIIIGAGPTGLGAAWRLHELGHTDFCVYEAESFVGGLAASYHDEKGFTWDLAVHVAHSHYHYVDRLMDDLLPDGFYHHIRKSWVRLYGAWVPYPFQYNIRHLPQRARDECLDGLRATLNKNFPAAKNFGEWILQTAGTGIANHFLFPYNRKLWTVDPFEMNAHWIGDRVPKTDFERVERNIREGRDDVSWGPNATFRFPKKGGTGAIWNAMAARLPRGSIRLSTRLVRLHPHDHVAAFSDGTRERYDALISTIPFVELTRLIGDPDLHRRASGLRHNTVHVVGVAAPFPIPELLRDKTWVYTPEDSCPFYRVTPFSIFSPAHTPDPARYCSFLCEIARPADDTSKTIDWVEPTLDGLRAIGLVDIPREKAHIFLMKATYGYPIPTLDRDEILADVIPALEQHGIYSRGRFGGWKYEVANMDHSIMQGVEAANRLLRGEPEVTLFQPNLVNAGKR
ncbi:MAG: FAD-dependent oxidoreductase [Kiritimatiellae bacterium]|nr:FAD-dependent oxidoreductase [Kiritimatiellia bacterium]MDW8459532.1 FAD-dependent oxidoreductase [Verrucomicrobiota bacterium]